MNLNEQTKLSSLASLALLALTATTGLAHAETWVPTATKAPVVSGATTQQQALMQASGRGQRQQGQGGKGRQFHLLVQVHVVLRFLST